MNDLRNISAVFLSLEHRPCFTAYGYTIFSGPWPAWMNENERKWGPRGMNENEFWWTMTEVGRRIFQHFSRSTRFTFLCTFGVEVEKTMENHLVDPTEKAENADLSENVTDKRNQKYITPNTRLTIFVQQCAANTRLTQKLRSFWKDFKFRAVQRCPFIGCIFA